MTDIETAWVAGIFEGEGCFGMYKRKTDPLDRSPHYSINVTMTDEDVILKLARITGMGHCVKMAKPKKKHHKQPYRWHITKRSDIQKLLTLVLPHMCARRGTKMEDMLKRMLDQPIKTWRHGTRTGYESGCRCARCTAANTIRVRNSWRKLGVKPRGPAQHGTRSKYVGGCRCQACTKASAAYNKQWRSGNYTKQPHAVAAAHGTASKYTLGCRCQDCRKAAAAYGRQRYAKLRQQANDCGKPSAGF